MSGAPDGKATDGVRGVLARGELEPVECRGEGGLAGRFDVGLQAEVVEVLAGEVVAETPVGVAEGEHDVHGVVAAETIDGSRAIVEQAGESRRPGGLVPRVTDHGGGEPGEHIFLEFGPPLKSRFDVEVPGANGLAGGVGERPEVSPVRAHRVPLHVGMKAGEVVRVEHEPVQVEDRVLPAGVAVVRATKPDVAIGTIEAVGQIGGGAEAGCGVDRVSEKRLEAGVVALAEVFHTFEIPAGIAPFEGRDQPLAAVQQFLSTDAERVPAQVPLGEGPIDK